MNGMFGGMWIFWIAVIALVVWIINQAANRNQTTNNTVTEINETPLDILKKRYAKGEITNEQFNEMKRNL